MAGELALRRGQAGAPYPIWIEIRALLVAPPYDLAAPAIEVAVIGLGALDVHRVHAGLQLDRLADPDALPEIDDVVADGHGQVVLHERLADHRVVEADRVI